MRFAKWSCLAVLAFSFEAYAANPVDANYCAAIQDAVDRIACYDDYSKNKSAQKQIGDDEAAAREAVKQKLIDPKSAVFGEFTLIAPGKACLTVNSKNSFGDYTGDKEFALIENSDGWYAHRTIEVPTAKELGAIATSTLNIPKTDKEACRKILSTPDIKSEPRDATEPVPTDSAQF